MKSSSDKRSKPERGESSAGSSSGRYKGVRMRKWGKWVAEVRLPNSRERIWLGSYDAPEKAARAYDAAVFCLRGPSATFNFPDSLPDIPSAESLTSEEIGKAARRFALEGSAVAPSGPAPLPDPKVSSESPAENPSCWPVMDGNSDLGLFDSPFDEFPTGWVFTAREGEEDDDDDDDPQNAGGAFYPSPGLWSF
ncbi:ethylene-responsive transcription factor ERF017-like [Magnolia sinica]|uniref:ethylene-responsive transcription factor ERF017-like n=1 Tax=Magnolia sinica TaxID=86752 RepID=UPI0026581083|nr:ethylene-responsive transcription factor ERF017-like [Magnolia sinica]